MMHHQSSLFLLASFCTSTVVGQSQLPDNVNVNTLDPDFVTFPDDDLNYPSCFRDLAASDTNGDGAIKANEYLGFVQRYAKSICHFTDRLTLEQRSVFNSLACMCQNREGYPPDCCLGSNAEIDISGALDPNTRSQEQLSYLTTVCRVTDQTIGEPRGCPPYVIDPNGPPPFEFIPGPPVGPADQGGLSKGALAGIIVGAILAALLCLLCCCCCVVRRKKGEEDEDLEKQEEIITEETQYAPAPVPAAPYDEQQSMPPPEPTPLPPPSMPLEPPPQEAENEPPFIPAVLPVVAAAPEDEDSSVEEVRKASGSAMIESDDEEEEVRKNSGQAKIEDDDEDPNRRFRGAGVLPETEDADERVKLRPIEKEEEDALEWDLPGQAIHFPTEKDDMSGGEVDHYEPDGGVYIPERPTKDPTEWDRKWERPETEDPDEDDDRKHRIQAGLGEGAVWDRLGEGDEESAHLGTGGGDVFDWVVQSALGVLHEQEEAGALGESSAPKIPDQDVHNV